VEATMAKYKKVKFNPPRIRRMYSSGKNVSQIAQAIGYPPNTGNNRVRNLLTKAGIYKAVRREAK
jgi:DNA-binding NarL/FixJ family response regulator